MASKDKIWLFILGSIIGFVGLLMFYIDETLAMWQLEGYFSTQYYMNIFGVVFQDGSEFANFGEEGGTFVYAAIIVIVGLALLILAGLQGSKAIGLIAIVAFLGGLAYYYYSFVQFYYDNELLFGFFGGMGSVEGFQILWGNNDPVSWRLGNGFFIVFGGAIVSLIGLFRSRY